MNRKVGVGVIGVGAFGSLHAKVYSELADCELRAIADTDPERLDRVCASLGVTGCTDYRQILEMADVHAVSVCTTDELHVEAAVLAAHAGKHVFVEKPLALTPQGCDAIIEAADDTGVLLTVGHILRFDPRYVTAQREIAAGSIGEPVHMFIRRNNSILSAERLRSHTSALFFLGIHDIDFANWCMGQRPERVQAQAVSKILRDTPDTVLALLGYPGGAVAALEASWVLPRSMVCGLDARFDVVGTQGALYVNGGSQNVTIARDRIEQPELFYAPDVHGRSTGILRDELSHFVRCVIEGRQPVVSGRDGRMAVEVACAIETAYRTGDVVRIE
ncbi:MAG: Gfo/Idh/MocA family oxidoreductase [Chloroflexi bacterium]|nr:Gfo/Idh/MocA family oxidoreductase [Chloroflexota bacterium]